jgi:hypothetical protein
MKNTGDRNMFYGMNMSTADSLNWNTTIITDYQTVPLIKQHPKCEYCGRLNKNDAEICTGCGAPQK